MHVLLGPWQDSSDIKRELGWTEDITEVDSNQRKTLKITALEPGFLQFEAFTLPILSLKVGINIKLLSHQEDIYTSRKEGVYRQKR